MCYREENIFKQTEVPNLLTVLLSIPHNKLPWSQYRTKANHPRDIQIFPKLSQNPSWQKCKCVPSYKTVFSVLVSRRRIKFWNHWKPKKRTRYHKRDLRCSWCHECHNQWCFKVIKFLAATSKLNNYLKNYTTNVYRVLRGLCRDSLLWGNPVVFTDCWEILKLSWGFPAICKCYRVYPQHT